MVTTVAVPTDALIDATSHRKISHTDHVLSNRRVNLSSQINLRCGVQLSSSSSGHEEAGRDVVLSLCCDPLHDSWLGLK